MATIAQSPTYKATQGKDGNWNIFDVPVFAVHTDARGAEPRVFSKGWLQKALKTAQVRHGEGYYHPLHIEHHGEGEVKAAGKVRFTKIALHTHGGKKIPTLFADLVGVKPSVYKRIRKGELQYRSVEILDVDKFEIDSLALLDDTVPYFRFPLLKIGQESKKYKANPTPALAYSASANHAAVLFNFERVSKMADDEKEKEEEELKQEDDEEEDKKKFAEEDAAPAWADKLLKVLAVIAEAVGAEAALQDDDDKDPEDYTEEDDEEKEKQSPPAMAQQKPVEIGSSLSSADQSALQVLAMQDTVSKMQSELDSMKAEKRIADKAKHMRGKGCTTDQVRTYKGLVKSKGESFAAGYAHNAVQSAHNEPPRTFGGELPASDPEPAVVTKYAKKGPAALERARSLHRSFKAYPHPMGLEKYLDVMIDTSNTWNDARSKANAKG